MVGLFPSNGRRGKPAPYTKLCRRTQSCQRLSGPVSGLFVEARRTRRDQHSFMADEQKPFHNPFGALSDLRARMPEPPARTTPLPAAEKPARKGPARAVVRMERSGRGGKEVTVIEHLTLAPAEREVWLKALKNGLGCGGTVEADALVLQGDQRTRVPALLEARGVRKITVA